MDCQQALRDSRSSHPFRSLAVARSTVTSSLSVPDLYSRSRARPDLTGRSASIGRHLVRPTPPGSASLTPDGDGDDNDQGSPAPASRACCITMIRLIRLAPLCASGAWRLVLAWKRPDPPGTH